MLCQSYKVIVWRKEKYDWKHSKNKYEKTLSLFSLTTSLNLSHYNSLYHWSLTLTEDIGFRLISVDVPHWLAVTAHDAVNVAMVDHQLLDDFFLRETRGLLKPLLHLGVPRPVKGGVIHVYISHDNRDLLINTYVVYIQQFKIMSVHMSVFFVCM